MSSSRNANAARRGFEINSLAGSDNCRIRPRF
jgi:hypothetical protein